MYPLVNPVREYAWGSTTYLPDLLGVPSTGHPQAELWIGAHPLQPSMIDSDSSPQQSLLQLVESAPQRFLGRSVVEGFGERLPFLLKVLAVDQPLSLQLHPDAVRARNGFSAEDAAGIGLSAPERTFKDSHHKPELTYALTRFDTLCGFRRPHESSALLRELASHAPAGTFFDDALDDLAVPDEPTAVHRTIARALALPRPETRRCLDVVRSLCPGLDDDTAGAAGLLATRYPDDPGVLVALLMNSVRIEPGEALFVRPGTLHAHLRGVAVEVQACSDNTVRGGLTDKYVDVAELLADVDCSTGPVVLEPALRVSATETVFRPDVTEFELGLVRSEPGCPTRWEGGRPRAVLALDGEVTLNGAGHPYGWLAVSRSSYRQPRRGSRSAAPAPWSPRRRDGRPDDRCRPAEGQLAPSDRATALIVRPAISRSPRSVQLST